MNRSIASEGECVEVISSGESDLEVLRFAPDAMSHECHPAPTSKKNNEFLYGKIALGLLDSLTMDLIQMVGLNCFAPRLMTK